MPSKFLVTFDECAMGRNEFEVFVEAFKNIYWYENMQNKDKSVFEEYKGYSVTISEQENQISGTLGDPEIFWYDISQIISAFDDIDRTVLSDLQIRGDQVCLVFDTHPYA